MSAGSIFERQNQPDALLAARAFRRRYDVARNWRRVRVGAGLLIGTVGVLVALAWPSTSDYVSAAAAVTIVLGRTVFGAYEQRERRHGAVAQERFDTDVFQLPWSPSVAGPPPVREDICEWGCEQSEEGLRDWYTDPRPAPYPLDVLISQRSIITWARQDHTRYARLLRWTVGCGLLLTLFLGVVFGLSLGEYLLRLGIPVLPAALDVLDIAKGNADAAIAKTHLETEAESLLLRSHATSTLPTVPECRDLQNGIYSTRLLPGVPNWLYRRSRTRRQGNMDDAVRALAHELPAALR